MIRLLRINKMVQVNLKHEKISEANINPRINVWSTMGDAVAQWLVLWTYSHEVWVWDLAVSLCCVHGQKNCTFTTPLLTQEYWWLVANCQGKPDEILGGGGVVVTLWNGETSKSINSWSVTYLVLMTNSSWKKLFLKYYKFTQFQRKKSHNIKSFDKIKKYTLSQNAFTRKHLPFHWGLVAVIWFLVPSMFPKLHEVMP